MPISEDEFEGGQMHHASYGGSEHHFHAMSKAEQRRSNKPIMEKRRRARINHCLNELKTLILEAMKKDPARHSKLEKADILEMTVKHLQTVQRQQLSSAMSTDPVVLHKFKNGFNECVSEVSRYINHMDGIETGVKQRLVSHLANCVNGIQTPNTGQFSSPSTPSFQSSNPLFANNPVISGLSQQSNHPLSPEDVNNNHSASNRLQSMMNGLHLIPSRLPTGELALLLPNSQQLSGNILPFFQQSQQPTADGTQPDSSFRLQQTNAYSSHQQTRPQPETTKSLMSETTHRDNTIDRLHPQHHISAFTAVGRTTKLIKDTAYNLSQRGHHIKSPQPSPASSITSTTSSHNFYDELISPNLTNVNEFSTSVTESSTIETSPNTSGTSSEISSTTITSNESPPSLLKTSKSCILMPNKLTTPPVLAVKPLSLLKENNNNSSNNNNNNTNKKLLLLKTTMLSPRNHVNDDVKKDDNSNLNIVSSFSNNTINSNATTRTQIDNALSQPLQIPLTVITNHDNITNMFDEHRYENPALDYSMKKADLVNNHLKRKRNYEMAYSTIDNDENHDDTMTRDRIEPVFPLKVMRMSQNEDGINLYGSHLAGEDLRLYTRETVLSSYESNINSSANQIITSTNLDTNNTQHLNSSINSCSGNTDNCENSNNDMWRPW